MKAGHTLVLAASCTVLFLGIQSRAQSPLINIETVTVGDAGNAPNVNGEGAVSYTFKIGKYEVTIGQYAAFLNSVAATNTNSYITNLGVPAMETNLAVAGIARAGSGVPDDPYTYRAIGPSGMAPAGAQSQSNRPITFVSWHAAARFCNWLHNGATNGADTESGAYNLNGATSGTGFVRNANARWWIPNDSEWYKAAAYKGGSTNAGYWLFATQSDAAPDNSIGNSANQANCMARATLPHVFSVTQSTFFSQEQNYLTDVGAFSGSPSFYGTFDQSGNVSEWIDGTIVSVTTNYFYVARGGGFGNLNTRVSTTVRPSSTPSPNSSDVGFRVARASVLPNEVGFTSITRSSEGYSLSWTSSEVVSVHLQRRNSLSDGQWEIISSNNVSSGYLDTNAPADKAFYRLLFP